MDKYLKRVVKPMNLESESDDTSFIKDEPTGGFLPIFLCDIAPVEEEASKEREYSTHKTAVSIKDIMKKRRDITPMF